jgi:hypothetical protein
MAENSSRAKARAAENLLERKIYFYRLDAGQKAGEPVKFDPVPILQHISKLPFTMAGRYLNGGGGNLIFVEPRSFEYPQKAIIVLSRRTNLPEIERGGAMTALPLPEGGGLGEKTHVMFFGEYVAADFNFYGPRATKLSEYFGIKAKGIGSQIRLDHLIRGEALEDLRRLSGIVVARFKFRQSALHLVEQADASLAAAFRATLQVSDSDELEVVLRTKKRKFLSTEIFRSIRKLARTKGTYEEFEKLIAIGLNRETDEREEVNVLDDQLILKRKILKTDKNARAVESESAFVEIESAFQEVLPRLGSALTVR